MDKRQQGMMMFRIAVVLAAAGGLWLSFQPPGESQGVSLRAFSDFFLAQPKTAAKPGKPLARPAEKTLIASPAALALSADGTLYADLPDLQSVQRLSVDRQGQLYIATAKPARVWRLDTARRLQAFAGGGDGLKQLTATPDHLSLNRVTGMALSDDRTLHLVSGGKLIGIYQGATAKYLNYDAENPNAGYFYMGDRGGGVQKQVSLMTMRPEGGLAINADGRMFINNRGGIFQVVGTTGARLVSRGRTFPHDGDLCAEGRRHLLIAERHEIVQLDTESGDSTTVYADPAWDIADLETDGHFIYVLDDNSHRVYRIGREGEVSPFPAPEHNRA